MSQLLALSFDAPSSPSITLKGMRRDMSSSAQPYGWGMAWYPPEARAAVVVKDPTSIGDTVMTQVLREWARFHSTTFICHLRGAAQRISQENTHPFVHSYAGREWVLTHNGDLAGDFAARLPLGDNPVAEPVGQTDTEHLFCWLLGRMRDAGVRQLAGLGWERLYEWLGELNAHGTLNLFLSDGEDLIVYQDAGYFHPLHWCRRTPPHEENALENAEIVLDLGGPTDGNRSLVMFASDPLLGPYWEALYPGQMMVVRGGAITWDSQALLPTPPATDFQATHAPPTPRSAQGRRLLGPKASQLYRLTHTTVYRYATEPVERSHHVFRLAPVHDTHQEIFDYQLLISPGGIRVDYEDVFGNRATAIDLDAPFSELRIESRGLIRVHPVSPDDLLSPTRRSTIPLVWMPWQRQMMMPYLLPTELPETQLRELFDYAMSFVERQGYDLVETLVDMNLTIYRDYDYVSGSTHLETTPFEVYSTRRGVCQDFANLLICLSRLIGIPARYRVGYIHTGADYENKLQSEASHAWVELYLPWCGWRGFDPTNGCLANTDHLLVACGRNYRDATPTSGTIYRGGQGESLEIDVRIEPIEEELDPGDAGVLPTEQRIH